jgi:hypothetical protein
LIAVNTRESRMYAVALDAVSAKTRPGGSSRPEASEVLLCHGIGWSGAIRATPSASAVRIRWNERPVYVAGLANPRSQSIAEWREDEYGSKSTRDMSEACASREVQTPPAWSIRRVPGREWCQR